MEKLKLILDKDQASLVKRSLSLLKSNLSSGITNHKKSLAHCKRSVKGSTNSKGYSQKELEHLGQSVDGLERVIKEKSNRLNEVDKLLVQLKN